MSPRDPVRHTLQVWKSLGFGFLEELAVRDAPAPAAEGDAPGWTDDRLAPAPAEDLLAGPELALAERVEVLDAIAAEVAVCQNCLLCHSRARTVPGEGDPMAPLMFVGEGPGQVEDETGRPFVGPAGELLTKIIEAMQFRREDVFIANVVKCRPPGNRTPEPPEMAECLPYLERQIATIRPRVIVALGRTALTGLLPDAGRLALSRVRGTWLEYRGVPLMPTFHPSYLLRSPSQKKLVWEDMQKVMKVFGKEHKAKG